MFVRQAISTRFIGASNIRGSRVKARAAAGSITLNWDHSLNIEQNHAAAAEAFATKYNWNGNWYQGGLFDNGYVFVCVDSRDVMPTFAITKKSAAAFCIARARPCR